MLDKPQATSPDRLLRIAEVRARTGLTRTRVYELVNDTVPALRFPAPVKIGRASHWIEAEVDAWIARQKARRPVAA